MARIKFIVDSPSDIPDEDLARYDIQMLHVPIQVDGKHYVERESFSCEEFYPLLAAAKNLPTTSRIPTDVFEAEYIKAWHGCFTDVIVVTINAGGSGIHESAQLAAKAFFDGVPEAAGILTIHVADSMTYTMAYGYPTLQAAAMAREGKSVDEILSYLCDFFSRVEIMLVCYTLEYAKRSGRITAAAALAGELLGLRPMIAMIDGKTSIAAKTRGERRVTQKLIDTYLERRRSPDDPVIVISAAIEERGQELEDQLRQELGRSVPHYKAGAAITINAGPRIVALCYLGEKRERDEVNQPSVITFNGIV